jgi:hypothetical protein
MLANAVLIGFLALILGASLYAAFDHLSRCPYVTILDVPNIVRQVSLENVLSLLDPRSEEQTRIIFSKRGFHQEQRLRLYRMREYLLRMLHNTRVIMMWADTEIWRETKFRPGMPDCERYIELSRKMHSAAIEFRIYGYLTLLRITFWMVFRTRPWIPGSVPRMADLREFAGLNFYGSYQRLRDAVAFLCLEYGEEFHDEIMSAI